MYTTTAVVRVFKGDPPNFQLEKKNKRRIFSGESSMGIDRVGVRAGVRVGSKAVRSSRVFGAVFDVFLLIISV